MILVVGSLVARADAVAEVMALTREHVERSRSEPGCTQYAAHLDIENPRKFVFVEAWADQASLTQHFKLPLSRQFAKALAALASESPAVAIYEAARVEPPSK